MKNDSLRTKLKDLKEMGWTLDDLISLQEELEQLMIRVEDRGTSIEAKTKEVLVQIGVPTTVNGYKFLTDSIVMYIENENMIRNISQNLYTKLSEKYKSSPAKVSGAIYHSIDIAFENGNIDTLNNLFGKSIRRKTGKPTPKQFIVTVAEYVKGKRKVV